MAVAADLGVGIPAIGQARTLTAAVALVGAIALLRWVAGLGVRRTAVGGAVLAVASGAAIGGATSYAGYLLAHLLVGLAVAVLLTAGFAGLADFRGPSRSCAAGWVSAAAGSSWVVGNPVVGALTEHVSWRATPLFPSALAVGVLVLARRAASFQVSMGVVSTGLSSDETGVCHAVAFEGCRSPPISSAATKGGSLKHIVVVGAVITDQGQVLCARRGAEGPLAGKWEFPGGKIEQGETTQAALAREIREELRCDVSVGDEVTTTIHDYEFARVTLTTFWCTLVTGELVATEHSELAWVLPEALHELDWAPADLPAVRVIQAEMA